MLGADNKVTYRSVELGPKLDGLRVIRTGLGKGDRIVVKGLQRVRSGMTVDAATIAMADQATLDHQAQMLAVNSARLLQQQQQQLAGAGLLQSTAAGSAVNAAVSAISHN